MYTIRTCAFLVIALCSINVHSGAPPAPVTESLVITSSESPKENGADISSKEEPSSTFPKIYQMDIRTNVSNRFATTQVISKIKNMGQSPQEATFTVILPETAYISGFIMEIDGKSYEAYVKEKEEAKQIYNQALQRGHFAGHVAASARDSNRFTVSVNIEPQSKATFKLSYEELLQRQNEQYELVLNIHPGQPVKDLNVQVYINETRPLTFVKAPSLRSGNEISKNSENLDPLADIKIKDNTATVTFNPDLEKQKQLAGGLGGDKENGLSGQFVVQYDVEHDPQGGEVLLKDGYFVHFFSPSGLPPLPKQVVFVLDTSGSMDGIRIQQLKEAMNSILDELKEEDIFNIVEFSSTIKVWDVQSLAVQYESRLDLRPSHPLESNQSEQALPLPSVANEENIRKGKEVVQKLYAYGGTDIKTALQVGLKLVKKNREVETNATHQPIIIFLTDGEPTVGQVNVDNIISSVIQANSGESRSPIFCLSFGAGADREFLQRLSLKNLGFARHIYEAADASLQLQEFYKQISSPLLSNIDFKYVSNVTRLTKVHFPIYFRGSEIVVAGRTDSEISSFTPPKIMGCGMRRKQIELTPKIVHPVGALERLWAYLTVKQILEERDLADNKTVLGKKALDIALKYSFVTSVSSLVVVKPNDTRPIDTEDASKSGKPLGPPRWYPSTGPGRPVGWPARPSPVPGRPVGWPARPSPVSGPVGWAYDRNTQPGVPGMARPSSITGSHRIVSGRPFRGRPSSSYPSVHRPGWHYPYRTNTSAQPINVDNNKVFPTNISDPYATLKSKLPWLNGVLSEDGTLTGLPDHRKLGLNEIITKYDECPKTPLNVTMTGECRLLQDCPQVFSAITSIDIFGTFMCPLDPANKTIVGVCCPKLSPPP